MNFDYLNALLLQQNGSLSPSTLKEQLAGQIEQVCKVSPGARNLVRNVEAAVRRDPVGAFSFDHNNNATLTFKGRQWAAGDFKIVSLHDLQESVSRVYQPGLSGRIRLSYLEGKNPLTDIGTLQAHCGSNTMFQVASQFNCLESPRSYVADISDYFNDPTQGPRASISAFPATFLRHYQAPHDDGSRFVQSTSGRQLNLLKHACDPAFVDSGYLTGKGIDDPQTLINQLDENFSRICIGIHNNVEVALGHNWEGLVDPLISSPIGQIFTSTIAAGAYGNPAWAPESFRAVSQRLLKAAYLGTLLAAVAYGKQRIVLTLIGGGVFNNRFEDIWQAILRAAEQVEQKISRDLHVIVNGYVTDSLNLQNLVVPAVRRRNGFVACFDARNLRTLVC